MLPVLRVGFGDKEKFLFFFLCVFPHPLSGVVCSVTQSCLTLCDPVDHSLPSSSVHGIFKARILEWVAISFPGDLPNPGMELLCPVSPALAGGFYITEPSGKPSSVQFSSVAQSCLTLCDSMNHKMPGLPVHHQLPEFTQTHVH